MRLLGAADALRHRRFGHQERAGDLGRGQAADGAQRQRDGRRARQRRMAAHEQQDQRVVLRRPVVAIGAAATSSRLDAPRRPRVSRRRRAISLRTWSVMRRDATWISQPRGLSGTPSRRPLQRAASSASCTASSAAAKSPKRRTTAPSTCGASSRSRCSASAHGRAGHSRSSGGALITWRTSIGMFSGTPPVPGAAEAARRSA